MLCASNSAASLNLLKHALQHLPKEITERMLRQQSKENRWTVCLFLLPFVSPSDQYSYSPCTLQSRRLELI